jgi:integrase
LGSICTPSYNPRALSIKVAKIDSSRMVVRIEQGKGGRDRYVVLSPQLLGILRSYWRTARLAHWLSGYISNARPFSGFDAKRTLAIAVGKRGSSSPGGNSRFTPRRAA